MAENKADEEYSVQYYGFSPETFFKDFSETILEEMSVAVQQSMSIIESQIFNAEDKEEIIKNFNLAQEVWSQRTGVILENLKPIIDEFFQIPKNVLLPIDEGHVKQYTPEEIQKLEDELNVLEEEYGKEVKAVLQYKKEIAIFDKLEPVKQKVNELSKKIEKFGIVIKEIEELEEAGMLHKDLCKKILDKTEYEDLQESIDLALQETKFKTAAT